MPPRRDGFQIGGVDYRYRSEDVPFALDAVTYYNHFVQGPPPFEIDVRVDLLRVAGGPGVGGHVGVVGPRGSCWPAKSCWRVLGDRVATL